MGLNNTATLYQGREASTDVSRIAERDLRRRAHGQNSGLLELRNKSNQFRKRERSSSRLSLKRWSQVWTPVRNPG